jgi:hypothetical protein
MPVFFFRLLSELQGMMIGLVPPTDDAVEPPPASPRGRAAALLRRAEDVVPPTTPAPGNPPDRRELAALASRYLAAGWRQWEAHHWGSAGLFAELALEWAARGSSHASGPESAK